MEVSLDEVEGVGQYLAGIGADGRGGRNGWGAVLRAGIGRAALVESPMKRRSYLELLLQNSGQGS